jgi:hypothetical protein
MGTMNEPGNHAVLEDRDGDLWVRFETHNDPACGEHAHCVCGGLMSCSADTGTLVCDDCRTDALVEERKPAEVAS